MGAERAPGLEAPIVVAWDTCTLRGVIAAGAAGRLIAETYFEARKGHTGWLMPQLDATLEDLGLSPFDIDYVAAGIGPGTFTGVKVGVACAKAVAMALQVPLVGMPTLDVLAGNAPGTADLVLSTIDARRGQLYAAAYRQVAGKRERVTGYMCMTPIDIVGLVAPLGFKELAVTGEAAEGLIEALRKSGRVVEGDSPYPKGGATVDLACEMAVRGETTDAVSVVPLYLKEPT
jgi:tRNA threonylcarbamoyladenosine biosynthesis protein TsaB